jgi:hypothetical protein
MTHRRAAPDLDWSASASSRDARPLFCAVGKSGRVTGAALSDKAVARLVKQAALDAGLDPERYPGIACAPAWPPPPATTAPGSPSRCARHGTNRPKSRSGISGPPICGATT